MDITLNIICKNGVMHIAVDCFVRQERMGGRHGVGMT